MTTTSFATFRKTKSGEWVAYTEAGKVHAGCSILIRKANGEIVTRRVARVGKEFQANGKAMVYGYLVETDGGTKQRTGGQYRQTTRRACSECGEWNVPGTKCWETGMLHTGRDFF